MSSNIEIPLVLFDINNNLIPIELVIKSNTFFIKSYQTFSIKIHTINNVNNSKIFSVILNQQTNDYIIDENIEFNNDENYSYTIYLEEDILIEIWNQNNESKFYHLKYKPDIIHNEYYQDLIDNYNLPNKDELIPALISNENQTEIVKRLLLDFRKILANKGKLSGIEKFLNLIGFKPNSIKIYSEYITPEQNITINPDKTKDVKTGNYHILYDNWEYKVLKYTTKNLPNIKNNITNLDEFFKKLWYAISLANKYFTLPEQDITFFGVNNQSNCERYLSVTSNHNMIYKFDIFQFRKNIHINIINYSNNGLFTNYLVKNNLIVNSNQLMSEVKVYNNNWNLISNNELYKIDDEIFDDANLNDFNIRRVFGNILHMNIKVKDCYVEYIIEKTDNQLTQIKFDKQFIQNEIDIKYVANKAGNYRITILVYDKFNNREKYYFDYKLSIDLDRFDFQIYNTSKLVNSDNKLNTNVESFNEVSISSDKTTKILPNNLIPLDLSNYDNIISINNRLINNIIDERFNLKPLNDNFSVLNSTESIPVNYLDNFLHVITIKYNPNKKLVVKVFDSINNTYQYLDYFSESFLLKNNYLFVTLMDIIEDTVVNPYIFISTIYPGIELSKNLYNLGLINIYDSTGISFESIFTDDLIQTKLPLNYHIDLFHRESELVSNFNYFPQKDFGKILTRIESLYPKMINIDSSDNTYYIKLGDIIFCKINENQIVNLTDIKWSLINEFTGETIFETTEYILKYRVNEQTIYSIKLEFNILGVSHTIIKKSKQSSFLK